MLAVSPEVMGLGEKAAKLGDGYVGMDPDKLGEL